MRNLNKHLAPDWWGEVLNNSQIKEEIKVIHLQGHCLVSMVSSENLYRGAVNFLNLLLVSEK